MARKTAADLKPKQLQVGDIVNFQLQPIKEAMKNADSRHAKSWAVIGIDTSMTAISFCGIGYDHTMKKMTKVRFADNRWTHEEDDYFGRLRDCARAHELSLAVTPIGMPLDRVFIYQEEPVPLGMMKGGRRFEAGWVKQQCEISGAVLGSLTKWGYTNIWQINNQQWKKTLRKEGVIVRKMPEGKWDVKEWAMQAYGLPDLPDLVQIRGLGKVPRPAEGRGANAKAVQPDDIYDAAACMAFGCDNIEED